MSTATLTPASKANRAVLRTEFTLFRREAGSLIGILLFPVALLVILGSIPSFREADDGLGGIRLVDAYVPVTVLLAMIAGGIQSMPPIITGYRERGVLRRMSTTPVRPSALLSAQMAIHGTAIVLGAALCLAVGRIAFDVALPRQIPGYLLALVLSVVVALALGALIASRARTTKISNAVGTAVFFPAMFCAGVWVPVQAMPDALAHIVELTPFGAAAQAMNQAMAGDWPAWSHLLVLAVWAVGLSGAAARWFRWE
ncbi:ABC transporter permease [Streptomyces sp. VRA16 Mangrove soil]|uniref:ABC transporter permease n=1 Tax=Streptomyces sp. VRA16 Mangrove soil TaxID=2817434 RepID=UPI001A9E54F4|nr:ABC transporter permease [Streptomyces sp. VRA16 Mangrove soil]MBO1336427.1 ABC transporter permease [Streptomyces sp. VRA16 Mangrove soil]